MNSYEVIMTPDAAADLTGLHDYITSVLLAPDTALSYIRVIRAAISKLEYMASVLAPISEEPWRSRGVRKLMVKNFYIYYSIDEKHKRVYVMNIIYAKRDQLKQLARKNPFS